jgi:MerR family mercuric resistance operon transcriptional regulator
MRIGDVATATGLETQAIRFYERKGLLPPPGRSPNGYRVYDAATITRLEFIRSGQGAGLTLAEIATILAVRDEGDTPCAHVRALLTAKLADVHTRQRQLRALETELDTLIRRSDTLDPADCTDAQICHIITPEQDAKIP